MSAKQKQQLARRIRKLETRAQRNPAADMKKIMKTIETNLKNVVSTVNITLKYTPRVIAAIERASEEGSDYYPNRMIAAMGAASKGTRALMILMNLISSLVMEAATGDVTTDRVMDDARRVEKISKVTY